MTAAGAPGAVLLAEALSPDEVAPGWTALLIVIGLGVAVWLLWRSMNKQLRKVPPSFDEPETTTRGETTEGDDGPRPEPPADGGGSDPDGHRPAGPR